MFNFSILLVIRIYLVRVLNTKKSIPFDCHRPAHTFEKLHFPIVITLTMLKFYITILDFVYQKLGQSKTMDIRTIIKNALCEGNKGLTSELVTGRNK